MVLTQGNTCLLIRYNTYHDYDFILEHQKIIQQVGYVWMLKLGKKIPEKSVRRVINSGGTVLLRAPKKEGGGLYAAQILDVQYSIEEKAYPTYYNEILSNSMSELLYNMHASEKTWLKIVNLNPIDDIYKTHFRLQKNGKPLLDVLDSTRTAVMYVYPDIDMLFPDK